MSPVPSSSGSSRTPISAAAFTGASVCAATAAASIGGVVVESSAEPEHAEASRDSTARSGSSGSAATRGVREVTAERYV